jgi:hypothetical protein
MGIRRASRTAATGGTGRRQFLRRAGLASALTAGLVGTAEVTGLSTAFASTSHPRGHKVKFPCISVCNYTYSPGRCGPSGSKCPAGSCCFFQSGGCCGATRYNCITHSCNSFSICCGG